MECKLYSDLYDLDTVSLRYFNVYSEDQIVDSAYATAIANWMHHIRQNKMPFLNGDGTPKRDMIHVEDIVSANIFAMNSNKTFAGLVYDVGTGNNISLNEVIEIVHKYFPRVEFEKRPPRKGDVSTTKADIRPLKDMGWIASTSITEGLSKCFKELTII